MRIFILLITCLSIASTTYAYPAKDPYGNSVDNESDYIGKDAHGNPALSQSNRKAEDTDGNYVTTEPEEIKYTTGSYVPDEPSADERGDW